MKKLLFLAVALTLMAACGNNGANSRRAKADARESASRSDGAAKVYKLDDLLSLAEELIGKEVIVRGHVTHTCTHSGKRCFIVGDSGKTSFRVEAGGGISGFNRELTGSELNITGILRERRLSEEYLDQMEKDVNEKMLREDGSAESCATELANIEEMKNWMKENGKDYYAIYYMDGEKYEVVEK